MTNLEGRSSTDVPAGSSAPLAGRRRRTPAWRLLLAYVSPYRWTLLGGGLLGFLGGLAGLAQPLVAKLVVDTLGERRSLVGPIALLTAVVVLGAVLNAAAVYLLGRTAESVVLTARQRLVSHLLRLRMSALDRLDPGDLLSRVISDTTLLRSVCSYGLVQSVNSVFLIVGSVVLMALLDPLLLGVTLAVLAVNGVAVLAVVPRIRRSTELTQAAVGGMGGALERSLGAFGTMKASGAEEREITSAGRSARRAWRRGVEVAGWTALMEASAGLAVQLSFLAVLSVGGAQVASGALPVSSLIAFLLYLLLLSDPLTSLAAAVTQLQAGLAAVVRMRELQDMPAEPSGEPAGTGGSSSSVRRPASLSFDRVWFRYEESEDSPWVHRDLTFELPPGGMTAIVGPSGAGKSTVFALVERFYEPQRGTITVDGRDIRDWPLDELRAAIGYVEQDAPVLAGTLGDNLGLAAPDAPRDELHAFVAPTNLSGVLARLPDGLDSEVGHRGGTLSGGERQRIAIARALVRRPRILLLDEATSQLDAVNELALRDLIGEMAGTTTVVVVAHRLSTVTNADRILVMEAGRVRAAGSHERLLTGDQLYQQLVTSQLITEG
jgi:ABC-type multidrug transport system fused ATPase/permease subunit